jgi:hypothetical protein
MPTKMQKSKEETRAAIEKEIASITTDLDRLRAIIHQATDTQPNPLNSSGSLSVREERPTNVLLR